MGYAELLKTVQSLPKDKQSEVFDFVTFLAARCGVAIEDGHGEWAGNEFAELSLRQAIRGMESEPAHYTPSDLKERWQ
ncbi:MAG: hypothetical protein FD134_148 [Gallionellaceae bacterium]|nr:MAG: hypothetical protein FD134_148 [Gallionellaceae bacterium]